MDDKARILEQIRFLLFKVDSWEFGMTLETRLSDLRLLITNLIKCIEVDKITKKARISI